MGIGAPPPRPAGRRTSRTGRVVGLLVLAALGATAWLFVWPPAGAPLADGPVVVLGGGGGERLRAAIGLVDEPAPGRELVLSEGAYSEWEVRGRTCGEQGVRCFDPQPANTFGEALFVAELTRERGWSQLTVVTSDYHVTRSRLYFHSCVDAEVALVAVDSRWSLGSRVAELPREILGTFAALGNLLHC